MKKNSRSSNNSRTAKNLRQLKRKFSRRQKASAEFQYGALEPKLPLDASFLYNGDNAGALTFNNFTAAESVSIGFNNDGDLVASLENGTWQGGFADDGDGTVAGGVLTVEGDFGTFNIQGLADGSVVTFDRNSDFAGDLINISSTTDFTVLQDGTGTGFDVGTLRVTGGTTQIFGLGSDIGNLFLTEVVSFEYATNNTINTGTLSSIPGGAVVLSSGDDVVLNSVNIPGTLVVNADGNVTRQMGNNAVQVDTFILNVDGNVNIQHLRASEIGGDVEGDFTITDSDFVFDNVDTTIVSTEFLAASGSLFFSFGLFIEGNLDWDIRFSSLTQEVDAPLQLSELTRIEDSPFLDTDEDAGTAIFRLISFDQTESILLAESDFNDFGSVDIEYIRPITPGYLTETQVLRGLYFNAIEFSDADSIVVGDINTNFVPTDIDQDATDTFSSRVRISAGRGLLAGEDFPVLVGNQIGNITINGQIETENLLLQAPGVFDANGADIDTHSLFLGGDLEIEGRANFQIVADSLQELSVNVFDSFDVVTQQELRIVAGEYLGIGGDDPLVMDPANDLGNVASGAVISIDTLGSPLDTEIALFDVDGNLISQNDISPNAGPGVFQSEIVTAGLADGTYFVAVAGFDSSFDNGFNAEGGFSSGDFALNVNGVSTSGTLAPSEVVFFSFNVGTGATQAPSAVETFNPEVFTTANASEFARIESTRLDFDVPFTTRKLVADVATDIEQADGAVVTIDELYIEAKRTVLENPANDFQRIAVLGDGFTDVFTDGISNNDEDVLVIRDLGTLEIASLDNQPIDAVATNFPNTPLTTVIDGISIDGTVDITTGLGGDVTIPRTGGPTAEQIGPAGRIERFTTVPGRTDIVFRDDNYDGSIRPAYFIEFIYDGTSDLSIRSDAFERRDPEPVRGELDIELALFNEAGDLLAVDDDDSSNEFDVLNLADIDPAALFNGRLPAGRYYVAASAFATEFEDGFVVNTSNNLTGTLNVTIANGAAFVAPETGRDLTQQPTAPLIVTGGEEVGDIEDGEPDGSVVLSALGGGAILLAETDFNDVRELIVNEAVGIEFTDFDDAIIVSNVTEPYDFARLSVGRGANGGVLTIGDFAADELLIQADTGVLTNGELDVPRLLIGGPEARDSGGDFALISPNTEELAFQFVNPDTDFALATNQDLVIGAFESRGGVLIEGSIGDEIRLQANSLTINSPLEATTKLVVEVEETLVVDASTFVGTPINPPFVDPANQLGNLLSGSFILIDTLFSTGDPELTLFDSAGSLIAQNDNVFDNDFFSESQILVDDVPDGTYFLAVSSTETTFGDGFNVVGGDSPLTYQLLANGVSAEGSLAANEVIFYSFTVGDPDNPAPGAGTIIENAITTEQLFFTGATLDLSQVNNQIGQVAANVTGADGEFRLSSSMSTTVASLDNSIDVDVLPTSDGLSFNEFTTQNGISSSNDLTFDVVELVETPGAVLQGRTLTINSFSDISLSESNSVSQLIIPSANAVSFNNDRQLVVPTIVANSDVDLTTTAGDLVVETLTTSGDVTLTAADDIRDTDAQDGNRIAASTLNLVAGNVNNESPQFNGILLQTDVDTINADISSTESGDFILRELTDVSLDSVVAGNGIIDVVALGSIDAVDVRHTTENAGNTITLIAVGDQSDISVGQLSSGGAGDIRLIAGDDVNHLIDGFVPFDPNPPVVVTRPVVDPANQIGNFQSGSFVSLSTSFSTGDPELTLFNSAGSVIAQNDNFANDDFFTESNILVEDLPDDTYFIAVSSAQTTFGNDFFVVGGDAPLTFSLFTNAIVTDGTLGPNEVAFFSFTIGDVDLDPVVVAPVPSAPGLITGEDLFVLADNKTADDNSGIDLNTNVVSGSFQVGRGPDVNPNPGAITINELNALRLDYAKTRLGAVDVTAGGNLVTDFVQAEGINVGDAITLTANGIGADVVTNEVRVRLSTGGVAINAADDIRDVDSSDDRFIIASSVSLNAGNNDQDAFNGIIAQTRTNLISAQVTSETNASMFIFNQNALRLENTFVTNGNIGITNNGGNLQAADVSTGGQANSRIFLRTLGVGSDISIGRLEAADRGEIFLDSADDIFDSVFADELFVTAEFLSATARNNAIEAFDGVILNADVDSLFISQPNGGEEFIREI